MLTQQDPHSADSPEVDQDLLRLRLPPLTKIVATLGPSTAEPDQLIRLIEAGASVFRLNFSHGSLDEHAECVRLIRRVASELERPVAILGDLQGPKIRVGKVVQPGLDVETGSTVLFESGVFEASAPEPGQPFRFSCTYEGLVEDVTPGQRLLVDDGQIRMLCVDKRPGVLECSVLQGGRISSGKGINVPEAELKVDAVTERDWACVQWAVENDLDFLAMSFVRRPAEITSLQNEIERLRTSMSADFVRLPIIAKIELPQAVRNIESIVDVSDGIMVARGDLGVEMELARVPVIQKQLVQVAKAHGKPCIVATQMLQSMIEAPMPTRAEVSDVATAIFDEADAVMLSGETAVGKYPVLAVETMRRVSEETERYLASLPPEPSPPGKPRERRYRTAALAHGVWTVAQDVDARFIVVWSQQGGGARFLSQNNFAIPIVAMTSDPRAARQMQLLRSVIPFCVEAPADLAAFSRLADECLLRTDWARVGDSCVLVAGGPVGVRGVTNSLAIHQIGSPETGYLKHGR